MHGKYEVYSQMIYLSFLLPYLRFHPVVGGGANGSVIHYSRNDGRVNRLFSCRTCQSYLSCEVIFSYLTGQSR